jgi:hypothetical protein
VCSRGQVSTPLEPLVVGLIKGFIDDADLSIKLRSLYEASGSSHRMSALTYSSGGRSGCNPAIGHFN